LVYNSNITKFIFQINYRLKANPVNNPNTPADINPILHKIAHFNRVNRKNKKRDKSKKEDLSRCVHNVLQLSNFFLRDLEKLRDLDMNGNKVF
jgi:hypothetical protein